MPWKALMVKKLEGDWQPEITWPKLWNGPTLSQHLNTNACEQGRPERRRTLTTRQVAGPRCTRLYLSPRGLRARATRKAVNHHDHSKEGVHVGGLGGWQELQQGGASEPPGRGRKGGGKTPIWGIYGRGQRLPHRRASTSEGSTGPSQSRLCPTTCLSRPNSRGSGCHEASDTSAWDSWQNGGCGCCCWVRPEVVHRVQPPPPHQSLEAQWPHSHHR